jgi:hypothetical protein
MALLATGLEIVERTRPVVRLPIGLIFRDAIGGSIPPNLPEYYAWECSECHDREPFNGHIET